MGPLSPKKIRIFVVLRFWGPLGNLSKLLGTSLKTRGLVDHLQEVQDKSDFMDSGIFWKDFGDIPGIYL